jgi:hypothetical protein
MLQEKQIAPMSTENEDLAVQKIQEVVGLIPFMVSLAPGDKKRMPKMGKKTTDFVERSFRYMKENPDFAAPFISYSKVEKDMEVYRQLQHILTVLEPVYNDIVDTFTLISSEAYKSALVFYNTVKSGAKNGQQRCGSIYKDLRSRFSKSTVTETVSNNPTPGTDPGAPNGS